MTVPKKSQRKISDLERAIARGDFAAARRLISGRIRPRQGSIAGAAGRTPLDKACGFQEISVPADQESAACCMRRREPADLTAEQRSVARQYVSVLRGARQRFDELDASAALCHAANASPEEMLLVSAETWRRDEPAVFLVGMAFCEGGELRVEQYFARDERQEPAVCRAFGDRCAAAAVVATFRGRRSQFKALRERCKHHGVDLAVEAWGAVPRQRPGPPPHLDLRKECRARWPALLGDCGIETVERRLLRRTRKAPIARGAIEEAYRRFLAGGDGRDIPGILEHNLLDLLTMAELLCLLLTACEEVEQ